MTPEQVIDECLAMASGVGMPAKGSGLLGALAAAGFKVLPREPTDTMLDPYLHYDLRDEDKRNAWKGIFRAMWDAAR